MATINEINSTSAYTGNPVLGGRVSGGINIDATPLQKLAQFNYYRDRDLWEQKLKDDAKAAEQIANLAAFDITSPLTGYRDALKNDLASIQDFVRQNPDALVYSKSPEKYQQLNEMINGFANKRKMATASDVIYNARKSNVEKEVDPLKRGVLQQELDLDVNDLFASGVDEAFNQTLKTAPEIKIEDYQIPTVPTTEYDVIDELPNSNITSTVKFINPDELRSRAEAAVSGFGQTALDENAEWFKSLPEERKQLERNKASLSGVQRRRIGKSAADFNSAMQQVLATNPEFNFATPNTGIKIIDDNIAWVNSTNDQIDDLNIMVADGKIKDPTGRVISSPFAKINIADGLSESEIVMLQTLQQSKTPLYSIEKKTQQTDNAIQKANLGLGYSKLAEDRRQFNATQGAAGSGGVNGIEGNVLNDIELPSDVQEGVYNMVANKQNLANISRLIGNRKDAEGKDIPILTPADIKSNNPKKAISYEVVNVNGQPQVSRIQVDGTWFDRDYFRNAQLNADKEPIKGQKTTYKTSQSIKGQPAAKVSKKEYTLGDKTFTISQIEKAAKQSGVSVDEYIKQVGLK